MDRKEIERICTQMFQEKTGCTNVREHRAFMALMDIIDVYKKYPELFPDEETLRREFSLDLPILLGEETTESEPHIMNPALRKKLRDFIHRQK